MGLVFNFSFYHAYWSALLLAACIPLGGRSQGGALRRAREGEGSCSRGYTGRLLRLPLPLQSPGCSCTPAQRLPCRHPRGDCCQDRPLRRTRQSTHQERLRGCVYGRSSAPLKIESIRIKAGASMTDLLTQASLCKNLCLVR